MRCGTTLNISTSENPHASSMWRLERTENMVGTWEANP
jgi:hypothetical protein